MFCVIEVLASQLFVGFPGASRSVSCFSFSFKCFQAVKNLSSIIFVALNRAWIYIVSEMACVVCHLEITRLNDF
jgi:hypothetical protein